MALTNSERQAAYRGRIKESGDLARLNMVVDSQTDMRLEELAKKYGVTKTNALAVALAIIEKDEIEARTRSKATGKTYRTSFARALEEAQAK